MPRPVEDLAGHLHACTRGLSQKSTVSQDLRTGASPQDSNRVTAENAPLPATLRNLQVATTATHYARSVIVTL